MPRRQHPSHVSGFSLVELAIVLAILGLLIGGVLAGQSLIKGQQLRTVLTDASTYATAINQFKLKYSELPGDMPTATSVWGSDAAACTSALDAAAGTCNGNGDSFIDAAAAVSVTGELFQLWRQLTLAGMISGTYSGINGSANINYDTVIGVNSPKGILPQTTYAVVGGWRIQAGGTTFYEGDYTNVLLMGTRDPVSLPLGVALTSREAFELDTKGDDGKPAYGSIRMFARTWSGGTCTSSDTPTAAVYNVGSSALECRMLFMNTFMQGK